MAPPHSNPTKRHEPVDNPFWVSYADLMTALMLLFLVVMSLSVVAISSRDWEARRNRDRDIQAILNDLKDKAAQKNLPVTFNPTHYTIGFGEQVRFAHNSHYLSEEARTRIRRFVPVLLELQASQAGRRWLRRVHIEGYTDETGTYLYNVDLSLRRAQAVLCTLLSPDLPEEQKDSLKKLLIIDGASTTSIKDNREESRRVEVRLEFRSFGNAEVTRPLPKMPLGQCPVLTREVHGEENTSGSSGKNPEPVRD
ncbi:MAG: OmpA family protein [Magnetococcales bacterium]|nr:OmpA family protein [Magnetococcales bacterium]